MSGYTVTRKINVDSAHRVPNHKSACRNFHGHTYIIHATFESKEVCANRGDNQEGMVVDFGFMKEFMMETIHKPCDHAAIIYFNDPLLTSLVDTSLYTIQDKIVALLKGIIDESILAYDTSWVNSYGSENNLSNALIQMRNTFYYKAKDINLSIEDGLEKLVKLITDICTSGYNPKSVTDIFHIDIIEDRFIFTPIYEELNCYCIELNSISMQGKEGIKINVVSFIPTAENLARHWYERLAEKIKEEPTVANSVIAKKVEVWETPNCYATYENGSQ